MSSSEIYDSPKGNAKILEAIHQSNLQVNHSIQNLSSNMNSRFETMEFNFNSFKQDITTRTSNLEAQHVQTFDALNTVAATIAELKTQTLNLNERVVLIEKSKNSYVAKNDPNKVYQTKFFNWRITNGQAEDLFTKWGMREFIDETVLDIDYKKSGKTIVTLKDGRAKYRFSCVIKTFLAQIQQDGVRLDEKYIDWIARECKTVQEWNEEEMTVHREKPGQNQNFQ